MNYASSKAGTSDGLRPLAIPVGPRLERVLQVAYRAARRARSRERPAWARAEIVRRVASDVGIALPLFRINRGDGGFYIDKASVVSRDPDDWDNEDVQNVGIYRLEVKGRNRLGTQPVPEHDIAIHLAPRGAEHLALFAAEVDGVRLHRASYADVLAGLTYRLHDTASVLARWKRQIDALREAQ